LFVGAWGDLTDAGVSAQTRDSLQRTLEPLLANRDASLPSVLSISGLRARRAGSLLYVDLVAQVPSDSTVKDLVVLENQILATMKEKRKEVTEVRVKFEAVH